MQLGMIGLGKMGANMRDRLRRAEHEVIGYDLDEELTDVETLEELVGAVAQPRTIWVMVPHGDPTEKTLEALSDLLDEGDLIIEGGNSHYVEDAKHAEQLAAKGIGFVDCGVSGGIWGLENGYGLMCGGSEKYVEMAMPIFDALRPEGPREEGFVHAGDVGAGHYAKMVHNGIEYGLMHAYAEGFELLLAKDIVTDVTGCFNAWSRGTVVRSWLLDLLVAALEKNPELEGIDGYTTDSGEGRWCVQEAIENQVPMPVISASLFARYVSRQDNSPSMQMVAALRGQFGGHDVRMLDEDEAATAGPSSGSAGSGSGDGPTSGSGSATH